MDEALEDQDLSVLQCRLQGLGFRKGIRVQGLEEPVDVEFQMFVPTLVLFIFSHQSAAPNPKPQTLSPAPPLSSWRLIPYSYRSTFPILSPPKPETALEIMVRHGGTLECRVAEEFHGEDIDVKLGFWFGFGVFSLGLGL